MLLFGVGAVTHVLGATVVAAPFGLLIVCLIFFALLRQTATGAGELDLPKVSDFAEDILAPTSRAVAATALLWVPSVIYLYWRAGQLPADAIERYSLYLLVLADPHVPHMVLAGLIYVPMALMIGAAGGTWTDCVSPVRLMGCSIRVAPQYVVAVLATLVLFLAWVGIGRVSGVVAGTGVPLVSGAVAKALTIYPIFVLARVLGLLIYVRGDVLGYGTEEEYLVPVAADPRPHGRAPVLPGAGGIESRSSEPDATRDPALGEGGVAGPGPQGGESDRDAGGSDPEAAALLPHQSSRGSGSGRGQQ